MEGVKIKAFIFVRSGSHGSETWNMKFWALDWHQLHHQSHSVKGHRLVCTLTPHEDSDVSTSI